MRRLIILVLGVVLTFALGAPESRAKLSRGDELKLKNCLSVLLDRFATDKQQEDALADFTDFFSKPRRTKILEEIDTMTELMAASASRGKQSGGKVVQKRLDLGDLGIEGDGTKFTCAISAPKNYQWTQKAPAWPLILCMPDKGQSPTQYLDLYWKSQAIRDEYIIAVYDYDYANVKVAVTKEIKEDGKVTLEQVTEEVPFSWDSVEALRKFWGGFVLLMQKEYKVDPNRVILDGAGIGADGALNFAAGQTWRFAGLVVRGGELDSPTLANLANLPVLHTPYAGAGEGAKKTLEALKAVEGAKVAEAGTDAATGALSPDWNGGIEDGGTALKGWLDKCIRNRYPLPCHWIRTDAAHQVGYWCSINGLFDTEQPAEVLIRSDRKKRRVDVEAKNVSRLSLFLNDILVDMEKPFEIYVNGEKVWEGEKSRSPEAFLDHAMIVIPADPGAVFTSKITKIDIAPPKAADDGDKKEGGDGKEGGDEKDDGK